MIFSILKRDLKRKRVMNFIMLLLLVLATVFVSAGLSNVVAVVGGSDSFLDMSGFWDVELFVAQIPDEEHWSKLLSVDYVEDYRFEDIIIGSTMTDEPGSKDANVSSCPMIQSISVSETVFFDKNNNRVTSVQDGHVLVPALFEDKWNLEVGDKLYLIINGQTKEYEIEGFMKDAIFGSQFMGNKRFIISENDYDKLLQDETIRTQNLGGMISIKTDDVTAVSSLVSTESLNATIPRSTLKLTFLVDMVLAFIVLILSICLIIVASVVMKFTINFTITEEYREIGVMKAIGISNLRIRSIYLVKYALLAIVSAVIGFFVSLPLCKLLLNSVSVNMVLGGENDVLYCVIGTVCVIILTILFAFLSTGKVKKASPVDAVRNGSTGERFSKKNIMHLSKSKGPTAGFLAVNDLLSRPKRYIAVVITLLLCTVFILFLSVCVSTLNGESIISMVTARRDVYFFDFSVYKGSIMSLSGSDVKTWNEYYENELERLGMPGKVSAEVIYILPFEFNGNRFSTNFCIGVGKEVADYGDFDGSTPASANEIAITRVISETCGAKIGDKITVYLESGKQEFLVTAYFDCLLNAGQMIRMHENAPIQGETVDGIMTYGADFYDKPDRQTVDERCETLKNEWGISTVYTTSDFVKTFVGSTIESLDSIKQLLLVITALVLVLVTVLLEQTYVTDEKSQIALLKATGFRNSKIVCWHMLRFIIASAIAVFAGILLSYPMIKLCATPLFGMLGAKQMKYEANLFEVLVELPCIILAATTLSAWVSSLATKRISSRDTSSIE